MNFTCSHQPLEWKFSQVFGESSPGEEIQNVDIISTLEFEKRGDYLAVGDQGGRVVIFERKDGKQTPNGCLSRDELEQLDAVTLQHPGYQYKMEFQSHEPEFDYLKSVEIEEKINKVKWCTASNGSLFILSTNDKTIKLWKVKDRKVKKVKEMDLHQHIFSENTLLAERSFMSEQHLPQNLPSFSNGNHLGWKENVNNNLFPSQELHAKIANNEDTAYARCQKVYGHAHDFNVNSISYNSDGETFLSADDLRINLWNLEINNQCFNIIDMKPSNMEDLTEIITSAEFHPSHCNLLAYSSSRGLIRLVDMRQSALCDYNARILKDTECGGPRSFFTEIVAAISDVKFSSDGQHILSRDYMNLKLWDIRKGSSPVAIFNIHEHLRPKLCDLYDKDSIFDKFECCFSGDGIHFATGSYSNLLHVFSHGDGGEKGITIEASKIPDSSLKIENRKLPLQTTLKARRSSLSNLTRRFHRQGHESTSLSSNDILGNLSYKISNPKDGSPALLIQDDGGGMDPDAMQLCMSFGFSNRKSKSAIGQYGNGFKNSSMRLGADVIVFSRHLNNRLLTRSIGLLSYTFLTRTGHDKIVVPMVDYQFNTSTGTIDVLHGREHFEANLSILLEWSLYATEAELMKEFDDIGSHGTKIIIYNLWFNNDGKLELDFHSDTKDIRIQGDTKRVGRAVNELNIANQYNYSLRLYLSILCLRFPETFRIVLRGEVVEHHSVVDDFKYIEYILYRPQSVENMEGTVVTIIGFLKEALQVNIHGFCVYHKNCLILPFWQLVSYSDDRGRGVVGALEANFVEPTHNKQDFERTSLFQKLECRLKEMTREYWDYHCGLIGYQPKRKPRLPEFSQILSDYARNGAMQQPVLFNQHSKAVDRMKAGSTSGKTEHSVPNSHVRAAQGLHTKRKEKGKLAEFETVKRRAGNVANAIVQPANTFSNHLEEEEANALMQENKKLHAKCLEYKKRGEELEAKRVTQLRNKIGEVENEYGRLLKELESLDIVKEETNVHM